MELGARIAHYRSQAGLNQSELARAMKPAVTPQTVQAWEKGGGIRPSKFESLASALGISLGTLLLGDDYADPSQPVRIDPARSEEHTSELQSLMRISYALFCLKKKKQTKRQTTHSSNKL